MRGISQRSSFQYPIWQEVFYGANYRRLKAIKDDYGPEVLFYAITAVSSELWVLKSDGWSA
ncbi:hypothetical protein F5Y02DRAFT_393363 [Annulohypoxylon stygium]|nr:hypothetical protein F5Y02DRAFT_393363 [Annulohypoxylon stygium]